MDIIYYPNAETIQAAIRADDPLLVLISHDGGHVIIGSIDDSPEHYILLKQVGMSELTIDQYFRIVLDKSGADWTFVCPPDYKGIPDKTRRITQFYKDGFAVIPHVLSELGYVVGINIPTRYRRHFDVMAGM